MGKRKAGTRLQQILIAKRRNKMKKPRIVISFLVTVVLMLGLALPVAADVEPPEVKAELAPGESTTVDKAVQTPPIPPKPDIYFMSDTTGSMGGAIAAVAGNADAILADIAAVQSDAQFGVGNYRDYPYDPYAFQHQQGITSDTGVVSTAINSWAASGGGDGPEAQFYALNQIATSPSIGWRDGSTRIVVWFGDAPAHDPVPDAATGLGYDITEATVTQALKDAEIRVIAISLDTGYYHSGLDDDPTDAGGDYAAAYGTVEDGTTGQASRIAAATGGVYLFAVNPGEVVTAILEGLSNLPITVTPVVVEPCDFLEITFEPPSRTVISGDIATFKETIMALPHAPQCETLICTVEFIDETTGEVIGRQSIFIDVLDITPPRVWCVESVNPHGNNVPGKNRSDNAKSKGRNPDGFYQLWAEDNCDGAPEIYVSYEGSADLYLFGPFMSETVVKFTEAPGVVPECKEMGSSNGQAGAVSRHIILPADPLVTAIDYSGNFSTCDRCLVPPPPK